MSVCVQKVTCRTASSSTNSSTNSSSPSSTSLRIIHADQLCSHALTTVDIAWIIVAIFAFIIAITSWYLLLCYWPRRKEYQLDIGNHPTVSCMDEKTSFFGYIDEQLFKTPQFHRILELSGEGSYASSPNGINTAPYTHSQECPAEGSFFPIASSANGVKAGLYTHPEGLPREESCFPIASSANVIKAGFYSNPAAPYDPDFERIMMFRDATSDRHHAAVDPVEDGENNFETPDSRPVLNRIQYSANIMVSQSPQHGSPRFRLPLPSWEGHNPMSAAFPSRSFQTDYGPNGLPPYDVSQHWDDPSTNIYLAKDQDQIKESSPDTTYQPPTPGHSCHQDCYSSIETALASMATSSSGLAEPPACLPPSLRTTAAASLPPSRKAPPKPSPVLRSNTVNTTYHHIHPNMLWTDDYHQPSIEHLPHYRTSDSPYVQDQAAPQLQTSCVSFVEPSSLSITCTQCEKLFRGKSASSNLRRHKKEIHSNGNNRS